MTRFALVAGSAAVFLTLCDQLFHVRTGTLIYHWDPQIAGQTILVPLTFLLAAVSMLDMSGRVHAIQPRSPRRVELIGSLVIVTSAYLISGFVDQEFAPAYAIILLTAWIVRIVRRGEGGTGVAAAVLVAVGGVLAEASLSAVGEFSYVHPDVLGVPWWLFPLYLHGALAARDLVAIVERDRVDQAVSVSS